MEFGAPSYNTQYSINYLTIQVNDSLMLSGSNQLFLYTTTATTIEARGAIVSSNSNNTGGGNSTIVINGSSNQTLVSTQTGGSGKLPNIKVNKGGGTLSLSGEITLGGSTQWEYTAGTVSEGTATLICYYSNTLKNSSGGEMKFYNLEMQGTSGIHSVSGTVIVTNMQSATLSGECRINAVGGNGILELRKDLQWNNSGTSTWGTVKFKFTGSNSQTISGTNVPQFYNLEVNKSGGEVTLNKEIQISNNAAWTNGYLVSSSSNPLTFLNGSTTSGASASSFVKGPVKKIGNAAFVFPIGKGTSYKPAEITAPSNATDAFTAEYFNTEQTLGEADDSLTYLSQCEYWNLDRNTGSSNVKVTLIWDVSSCDVHLLNTLRVARWTGTLWTNLSSVTTTGNSTAGTVKTNTNQSVFGYFIIAKNGAQPTANAGTDKEFCSGSNATLGGSPSASGSYSPYTYSWSPSTGLSNSTVANPTCSALTTTTYALTVTDNDGTVATDQVKVTVHSKPEADAGDDLIVCDDYELHLGGDSTAVGGTPPYQYVWANADGDSIFSARNPFIEPDTFSIFVLTVTDSLGCEDSDTIQIDVSYPIELDFYLDTLLFLNQTVLLEPEVSGGVGPLTYTWSPGIWLDDSTATTPICTPLSTTHYILLVEDSAGCQKEGYAVVNFRPMDLGLLGSFAVFSGDSIFSGDSTVTLGEAGANYIDTVSLYREIGNLHTNTTEINSLRGELSSIVDFVDGMTATSLVSDLSGLTIGSGIHRVNGSAYLNGDLTLSGNDSAYFIIDINNNFTIEDSSQIILVGVPAEKVIFSVNGRIDAGEGLVLNGTFLTDQSAKIGSAVGRSSVLSTNRVRVLSTALKFVSLGKSVVCSYWGALDGNIEVQLPKKLPLSGGPPEPSNYWLMFEDNFDQQALDITNNYDQRKNHTWYEWGGWGSYDVVGNPIGYVNVPGEVNYFLANQNLNLRLTNLSANRYQGIFPFSVSMIETNATFYHGYFEIKAKLPWGQGLFPAFWVTKGGCWNDDEFHPFRHDKREIDFFDGYLIKTDLPFAHFPDNCANDFISHVVCPKNASGEKINTALGWHIYACDWNEETINLYIDNVLAATYPNDYTHINQLGVRDQAMYLVLNNAVTSPYIEAGFQSDLELTGKDPKDDEHDFQIDYVRVWQEAGNAGEVYFLDNVNLMRADQFCTNTTFVAATTYIPGAKYYWHIPQGSSLLFEATNSNTPDADNVNRAETEIYSTGIGTKSITLSVYWPPAGNHGTLYESHSFNVDITGTPLGEPLFNSNVSPVEVDQSVAWSINPVSGADGYQWEFLPMASGATSDGIQLLNSGGTSCTILGFHEGTYKVFVRAHKGCGYGEWAESTLVVEEDCEPCHLTSWDLNSLNVSIYPNPSSGDLSIENNTEVELSGRIISLSGRMINQFVLSSYSKIEIDHLPPGIAVIQITDEHSTQQLRRLIAIVD